MLWWLFVPNKADGGILLEGAEQRRGKLSKRKEFEIGGATWPRKQAQSKVRKQAQFLQDELSSI